MLKTLVNSWQENDPDQAWQDELVRVALNTGEVRGKLHAQQVYAQARVCVRAPSTAVL